MKYKGIVLREGEHSEAELLVCVEIKKEAFQEQHGLEEYVEELEEQLEDEILNYDNCDVHVEAVCDDLLNVRCDDITFDERGVYIITAIYYDIKSAELKDVKVTVGVHVDGDVWFKREDGSVYNEDMVSLEEFLENVEY